MIEVSETVVRAIASVMGPYSASARAIENADERRANGQTVKFYKSSGSIIVQGQQAEGAKNGAEGEKQ